MEASRALAALSVPLVGELVAYRDVHYSAIRQPQDPT